jgi:hypothetical protein
MVRFPFLFHFPLFLSISVEEVICDKRLEIIMPTVFVVLAIAMMVCWLALAVLGPRRVDTSGAVAVLRCGVVMRLLALLIALTPLLIFLYAVWKFEYWVTQAKFNFGGITFLTLSAIVGLWLIEVARVQIVVTEDGITRSSPWSGLAALKWSEVERVRYSSVNRWFIVEGAGHTIRVSRYLGGIGAFADMVRRKVAPDRWASAAGTLTALGERPV